MGDFRPHVVLRNLTATPQTATITVEYPIALGWDSTDDRAPSRPAGPSSSPPAPDPSTLTRQTSLAPVVLPGYSTQDISLESVLGGLSQRIPYGSIGIQYSGRPGSIMAEVASVDESQDLVVDAKLQNEGNSWAGSGANPWHLNSETESLVFLTDMGDQPVRIGFKVWANGTVYYLTRLKLAPHETRVIDLRKLRDAQRADLHKNTIPAAATDGSVLWIRLDNVPVMGRVVVINRHGGIVSAYDCCTCPCPASLEGLSVGPGSFAFLPGQTMQCTCTATFNTCNGSTYPNETNYATWSSSNTAVATMDSSVRGLVHAVAAGTATINAQLSGYTYIPTPHVCTATAVTRTGSSSATVCDFSVGGGPPKPTCNGSKQTVTYTATPSCPVKSPPSSCTASLQMNSGYQGELGTVTSGTDPTTHLPTCTVTYFVGPAQGSYKSGTDVGTLSLSFTVYFSSAPQQTANQSQQVVCQ